MLCPDKAPKKGTMLNSSSCTGKQTWFPVSKSSAMHLKSHPSPGLFSLTWTPALAWELAFIQQHREVSRHGESEARSHFNVKQLWFPSSSLIPSLLPSYLSPFLPPFPSSFFSLKTRSWSYYVAQASLGLLKILLPQLPKWQVLLVSSGCVHPRKSTNMAQHQIVSQLKHNEVFSMIFKNSVMWFWRMMLVSRGAMLQCQKVEKALLWIQSGPLKWSTGWIAPTVYYYQSDKLQYQCK